MKAFNESFSQFPISIPQFFENTVKVKLSLYNLSPKLQTSLRKIVESIMNAVHVEEKKKKNVDLLFKVLLERMKRSSCKMRQKVENDF
jgi:hypothetical protein